jgi:hypothetical protein
MPEAEDDPRLTTRLDSILERLRWLELQVNRLLESQTVEARNFVVVDERNQPRARFEMAGHSPRVSFFDCYRSRKNVVSEQRAGTNMMGSC